MPDASHPEVRKTIQETNRLIGEGDYEKAWQYAYQRAVHHGLRGHSSTELYLQLSNVAHLVGKESEAETFRAVAMNIMANNKRRQARAQPKILAANPLSA